MDSTKNNDGIISLNTLFMVTKKVLAGLFVTLFLLFFRGELFASAWSFDQLIKEACASYPSVLSKEFAKNSAREDVISAKWQLFPTPSIETGYDKDKNSNYTARVDQPLWVGGRITSGIDSAKSNYDAADKAVLEDKYNVALKVIYAYVEAMHQQERKIIGQNNVKQHELLDETIKRRVEAEVSPEVDRRLSRTRLAQASNELSTFLQSLSKSRNQLSQLTGKTVTEITPVDLSSIELPDSKQAAIEQAIAISPTLSKLAFEEEAAKAQIKQKKSVFWPSLVLRYEKFYYDYADRNHLDNYSDDRFLIVLQAQPGAGLSAYSNMQSTIARMKTVQEQRKTSLRELTQFVSDAWDDMKAAQGRLEDAISAKSSSIDVYESYRKQFITGRKSWLDVMNAVREATQTEIYAEDVKALVATAVLKLALWTGKLNLATGKLSIGNP